MTTDDKTMIEQIETALQQATFDGADRTEEYAAAVLPIIRKAQADAWQAGMRYAIECGNETSDSFGNLYRIDWINRMEHEIEECRKYEIEKEQTNG